MLLTPPSKIPQIYALLTFFTSATLEQATVASYQDPQVSLLTRLGFLSTCVPSSQSSTHRLVIFLKPRVGPSHSPSQVFAPAVPSAWKALTHFLSGALHSGPCSACLLKRGSCILYSLPFSSFFVVTFVTTCCDISLLLPVPTGI